MSILFVVAPCNLFKSHLDVASQITGALWLPGSNPRTPLVSLHSRNVGNVFLFRAEEVLYFQSKRQRSPGSPSARGADRSKVRVSCRPQSRRVKRNPHFDVCWQSGDLETIYCKAHDKIKHDNFSLGSTNFLADGATLWVCFGHLIGDKNLYIKK